MELTNAFTVQLPIEGAWEILTDLERVAPCMPGAQLTEIEGDEYRGLMKVKVGPIVAKYQGAATFTSLDAEGHVATIKASGRDPRQGNADAVITATLTPDSADATHVDLSTDLSLSGKLASFGKGAIQDVSTNILRQFVTNLEAILAEEVTAASPTRLEHASSGPRRIEGPAPEPVDLAAVAGLPVLKRALPAFGVVALCLVAIYLWRRRRLR